MTDHETDTTRLRQRLEDLADTVEPDLAARAAEAIRAGRMREHRGRFLLPLAAAAAVVVVIAAAYVLASGGFGLTGSPVVGTNQSSTGSPSQPSSRPASPTQSTPPSETPSVTPTATKTPVNGFAVVGTEQVDVDGDGQPDQVTLLDNTDETGSCPCTQKLRVTFASGGTSALSWSPVGPSMLLPAVDLDGDGDSELVVGLKGAEYYEMRVYDADNGQLTQLTSLDSDGTPLSLGIWAATTESWSTAYTTDGGLADYQLKRADPGAPPFPVKVRLWTMTGLTLTRSDTIEKGCYDIHDRQVWITVGACP